MGFAWRLHRERGGSRARLRRATAAAGISQSVCMARADASMAAFMLGCACCCCCNRSIVNTAAGAAIRGGRDGGKPAAAAIIPPPPSRVACHERHPHRPRPVRSSGRCRRAQRGASRRSGGARRASGGRRCFRSWRSAAIRPRTRCRPGFSPNAPLRSRSASRPGYTASSPSSVGLESDGAVVYNAASVLRDGAIAAT